MAIGKRAEGGEELIKEVCECEVRLGIKSSEEHIILARLWKSL